MKTLLKLVGLCGWLAILSGCALLEALSPETDDYRVQKRLTYSQSDAVAAELITQLVSDRQSLLIPEHSNPDGWPLPSVGVVMMYEQQLCALDKAVRGELLNQLKNADSLPPRFQALVLASCAPDFTPSVLARSLKQMRDARRWPAPYQAYFDLLERHQQSLVRLEKLYGNLKERMDTTIEKLTEIEVETQP